MGDITRNFSAKEFACHCGACEYSEGFFILREFVEKLQMIRDWVDEPLKVNCGLRCPKHNKAIGGAPSSNHPKGMAADISCTSPILRLKIIQGAFDCNLTVGLYRRFLHLDMRTNQMCFFGRSS